MLITNAFLGQFQARKTQLQIIIYHNAQPLNKCGKMHYIKTGVIRTLYTIQRKGFVFFSNVFFKNSDQKVYTLRYS